MNSVDLAIIMFHRNEYISKNNREPNLVLLPRIYRDNMQECKEVCGMRIIYVDEPNIVCSYEL